MEPRSRLGQSGRAGFAVGYCLGIQRWYIVGMVLIWRQGSRTKYVEFGIVYSSREGTESCCSARLLK
jgi:hypothetical protein